MTFNEKVVGIRFGVDPITDNYKEIIYAAIDQVDTQQVWAGTDFISTLYRGKREAVFDAAKACFVQSYREGVHTKAAFTIEEGPRHAKTTDIPDMNQKVSRINSESSQKIQVDVVGKFGVYPFAIADYKTYIQKVIRLAKQRGVYAGTGHYASFLKGNVHDVFNFLEESSALLSPDIERFAIEVTLAFDH